MQDFCLDNLDVSLDQGIFDTHKGSFGHLLIASGDTGYGGAGIIASESAIMSGCGLVTLITKKEHIRSSLSRNPEVIAIGCLLYTSPSPRDKRQSRMPSSA